MTNLQPQVGRCLWQQRAAGQSSEKGWAGNPPLIPLESGSCTRSSSPFNYLNQALLHKLFLSLSHLFYCFVLPPHLPCSHCCLCLCYTLARAEPCAACAAVSKWCHAISHSTDEQICLQRKGGALAGTGGCTMPKARSGLRELHFSLAVQGAVWQKHAQGTFLPTLVFIWLAVI